MKITGITIENWRSIHRLELAFGPGITVVHGPNEAGKSTVQEAVRLALLGDASSSARELHSLVPWGSSAKAHVELSLESARGDRLRIVKSFPRGDARLFLRRAAPAPPGGPASPPSGELQTAAGGTVGREAPPGGTNGGRSDDGVQEVLLAAGRGVQPKILEYLDVPAEAVDLFNLLWIGQGESLSLFGAKPDAGPMAAAAQSQTITQVRAEVGRGDPTVVVEDSGARKGLSSRFIAARLKQ